LLPNESLAKLIYDYAGGFKTTASTAIVRGERITEREKKLIDITKGNFESFIPQDGDFYSVVSILNRFENAVSVNGAVFRPGRYSFQPGMKMKELLDKAEGLNEDVYTDRALLFRLKEDKTKEVIAVNLKEVLKDGKDNLQLQKDDSLYVNSISDLKDEYSVLVKGAVRKPGSVTFRGNMTVKDAILQSGGFTDRASLQNIEIARRKNDIDPNDTKAIVSDILSLSLDTISLNINQQDFKVFPNDIIMVKINPFKKPQDIVTVEGKVLYPGPIAIINREERISKIIERVGGPLVEANTRGAKLRRLKTGEIDNSEIIDKISKQANDSTGLLVEAANGKYDDIAIDLDAALRNPGGEADIFVREGDIIVIPSRDEMVAVEGEVLHPVKLAFEKGKSTRYYIDASGGFVTSANRSKLFVVYPNGRAAKTKNVLGLFRKYPEVKEGSQIFVPKYVAQEKPKKSAAEVMGIVTGLATLSYLLVTIVNAIK
jgi:protein involved in polysaccharide export with SLBB domain